MIKKAFQKVLVVPRLPFLSIIWLYQKTMSPDHGPFAKYLFPNGYCRFYPSCSEYGYQSYKEHGVAKGTILTTYRILRCNPFTEGGNDAVPKKGEIIQTLKGKHLFS